MRLLFAERAIKIALSSITLALTARFLQPNEFGILGLSLSVGSLFSVILLSGLSTFLKVELDHGYAPEQLKKSIEQIRSSLYCILSPLFLVSIFLDHNTIAANILAAICAFSVSYDIYEIIHLKAEQANSFARELFKCQLIETLIKLFSVAYFKSAYAYLVADIISRAIKLFHLRSLPVNLRQTGKPFISGPLHILRRCVPLVLSGLACIAYLRIDQVMISSILGEQDNGIYSAAVSISESLCFVPVTIVAGLTPSAFLPPPIYFDYNSLRKIFIKVFCSGIIITTLIYFLSGLIVSLAFGPSYYESIPILAILSPFALLWGVSVLQSATLVHAGHQRHDLVRNLIACSINITANLVLIPTLSLTGAAISTILSLIFLVVYPILLIRPRLAS